MADNQDAPQFIRLVWIDKAFSLARQIVTWAGRVLVVYFIGRMVSDLAGRTTLAEISLHFLAARNARELGSYVIAVGLLVWGIRERWLRKSTVRALSRRLELAEKRLDPDRSSSLLTDTGETRSEDR